MGFAKQYGRILLFGAGLAALGFAAKKRTRTPASANEGDIDTSDQVAFPSDLSSFQIGKEWYSKTVVPFVGNAAKQGTLDTAFEDFVSTLGVLVGQFVVPIEELPQDKESVMKFLDKLEEAIEEAKQGLV